MSGQAAGEGVGFGVLGIGVKLQDIGQFASEPGVAFFEMAGGLIEGRSSQDHGDSGEDHEEKDGCDQGPQLEGPGKGAQVEKDIEKGHHENGDKQEFDRAQEADQGLLRGQDFPGFLESLDDRVSLGGGMTHDVVISKVS